MNNRLLLCTCCISLLLHEHPYIFPEQYIERFPAGASKVAWWIMENRREYFDRAKDVLHRVKTLIFLSEAQSKQWQKWCEEESIKLRLQPALVPLSVNDELAFVAGIPSTLNVPSFSAEKMDEQRKLLRDSVRREMGLSDNDMLVITLSSINRGKGQLFLLESARSIVEDKPLHHDNKKRAVSSDDGEYLSTTLSRRHHVRKLFKNSSVAFNNISSTFINRLHESQTIGWCSVGYLWIALLMHIFVFTARKCSPTTMEHNLSKFSLVLWDLRATKWIMLKVF